MLTNMRVDIDVDFNRGQPIAHCKYKGRDFFTSPVKCRLATKPNTDDSKRLDAWQDRVKKAIVSAMEKSFKKTIYSVGQVNIKNLDK
ncbi:hypothetical protein [Psychrobacter pygoscelis]|uniref:hypothetical protein n=1 Tax=Psychrobacter pygoscelis TaxID=2488563 RepID=UPI00103BFACC|nr:hypothetical protein [Psychrobacter pygoscelis]